MTELIKVTCLATLQGIAEFLPVSSSGHLVLGKSLLGLSSPGNTLEIALHAGTLLSICVFYGASISALARDMCRGKRAALRYALAIAVSMVPCGITYALFGDWLEASFSHPRIVGPAWLVTAAMMFTLPRPQADEDPARTILSPTSGEVPFWTALLVGLGQAVAMLPGVSRSGTTIWVARRCRLPAPEAARFSFLMSLPVIGGATLLTLSKLWETAPAETTMSGGALIVGTVVAAVVGYASLALLMRMLSRGRFWVFGVYCAIAGAATTLWYLCHPQ